MPRAKKTRLSFDTQNANIKSIGTTEHGFTTEELKALDGLRSFARVHALSFQLTYDETVNGWSIWLMGAELTENHATFMHDAQKTQTFLWLPAAVDAVIALYNKQSICDETHIPDSEEFTAQWEQGYVD